MSDSPSAMSNGRTPTPTPNSGGGPQYTRKPKPADPLRPRKKPIRRPNMNPKPPSANAPTNPTGLMPASRPNGPTPHIDLNSHKGPGARGPVPINGNVTPNLAPQAQGGWTNPPKGEYQDYPLFTTRRALRDGLRYHAMRFAAKREIDPTNQDEFTRPISLHRRDPRQPPPGKVFKDEDVPMEDPVDSKEREKQEILKAEKEARKAADQAQIAPTGNNASNAAAAKKAQAFRNEKTTQVYHLDKTEAEKKQSDLRYEEALPWHLEDADNKNTWVGNYESALSEVNVIMFTENGAFKMIPVEKWYKFTSKSKFNTLSIEEAEAMMNKKHKESRWALKTQEKQAAERAIQEGRKQLNGLFTVKTESASFKGSSRNETRDIDELDFDNDELFQDDDELPTVEPDRDEDTKDALERIKQDQRGANLFGEADEESIEKDFIKQEQEEEAKKKFGKGVKKALYKREKNYIYDSDSSNPYASSDSEDDTSDEEKQKEIDKRKDEEAKAKAKGESKPSGTSSKGNNTPSGRPKHTDPLKKSKKRPASPNQSESSGNESSRKKHKKNRLPSSQPTGTSTPLPGSRPMSPVPSTQPLPGQPQRNSSGVKLNVDPSRIGSNSPNAQGATSDGEATGGEMSDGAGGKKKKKMILRIGGSPTTSRPASPAPGRAGSAGADSRSSTPVQAAASSKAPGVGPIQAHEIAAALPATGISIGVLLKQFRGRVGDAPDQTTKTDLLKLVKENSQYGSDKLLRPKP
ncbi:transcription factor IIF subunit tfg1 [Clarireedia jacksonii]